MFKYFCMITELFPAVQLKNPYPMIPITENTLVMIFHIDKYLARGL